jgi:dihydrofolate reductase
MQRKNNPWGRVLAEKPLRILQYSSSRSSQSPEAQDQRSFSPELMLTCALSFQETISAEQLLKFEEAQTMPTNKVFFDVMMSLDGLMAPEGMDLAYINDPDYKQWMKKWMDLSHWVSLQKSFRENLKIGTGGETGRDNTLLEETTRRTGVSIMGKNMFSGGERLWPEEAPFHTPVFVLTNEVRQPWERPGGTTFYFINDGIESALHQAREVAGNRDIRIAGGANTIQQYLNAGLIDEFTIHYSPVFFGQGTPLFVNTNPDIKTKIREVIPSKEVTHIIYDVEKERTQ